MIRLSFLGLHLKWTSIEVAPFLPSFPWSTATDLFSAIGLIVLGLLQLGLYTRRRHHPETLYLAGSSLLAAAGIALTGQQLMLGFLFPLGVEAAARIGYSLLSLSLPLLVMFLRRICPAEFSQPGVIVAQITGFLLGPAALLTPVAPPALLTLLQIVLLLLGAYALFRLAVAARRRRPDAVVWLYGLAGLWLAATHDVLLSLAALPSSRLLGLGLLILTVTQGIVFVGQMSQALALTETSATARTAEQKPLTNSERVQLEQFVSDRTAGLISLNHKLQNEIAKHKETAQALSQAMAAAQAAAQAKDAFLAHMSHELRTPLSSILGYAQILKRDKSLRPDQREFVTIIQQSGEYLLTLLNDILDFSKIEAGQMELHQGDFNLPNMLKNMIDIFQIRAQEKDISFVFSASEQLPSQVRGDEKRLRQVLINLLGNAIKFTSQGSVTLRVDYQPQGLIRFQVEDSGIGIEPEYLQEIFHPFKQVRSHQNNVQGTGLGLTISKRLVEMMKSELTVRSRPGWGSTFWFDVNLPVVDTRLETIKFQRPTVVGYQGRQRKILVIDSEPDTKMILAKMLLPLSFDLYEAAPGEGLTLAKVVQPDAILVGGAPALLFDHFLEQLRQMPRLVNTAVICLVHGLPPMAKPDQRMAYLTQPVKLDMLLDQLDHLLRLRWIFAPAGDPIRPVTAGQTNHQANYTGPPPATADLLFELTLKGDVKRIKEQIAELAALDEVYRPFVTELGDLLRNYQINQIRELLRPYVSAKQG